MEYQVTGLGRSLRPALDSLAGWMQVNAGKLVDDLPGRTTNKYK